MDGLSDVKDKWDGWIHRQPWFYHKIACHFASLEDGKLYIVRREEHDEFGFSRGSIPELTLESRKISAGPLATCKRTQSQRTILWVYNWA